MPLGRQKKNGRYDIVLTRVELWAIFGFVGGFGFGKSVEIIKTQTQNAPQKVLSVSVLVYQFWVVLVMLEKNIAFAGIYLLNELSNLYNLYKTIITSINT